MIIEVFLAEFKRENGVFAMCNHALHYEKADTLFLGFNGSEICQLPVGLEVQRLTNFYKASSLYPEIKRDYYNTSGALMKNENEGLVFHVDWFLDDMEPNTDINNLFYTLIRRIF